MPVFVTSLSQAKAHGVYAFERQPPAVISAQGSAVVGMVEQFPWGPDQASTEISDPKSFIDTFAPYGFSHTDAGYMAVTGKSFPTLKLVRVTGSGKTKATATVNKTGPTAMLTLTLKYYGAAGNSVTWTTSAATDGDANHFNLAITITGASGTTTDLIENLNYSGVGADSTPNLANCFLIGSIAKVSAGVPILGSGSFATGADGTINSAAYIGTQGAANQGASLFEGEPSVDFVITGDPGNSLRAAVNAGLVAHADYMGDRQAFINGDSGLAQSAVITDVANYRSIRACYIDVWAYTLDDVDGTERLEPPAPFFASVAANLSPSTSPAWKSSVVKSLLRKIKRLESYRGLSAASGTDAGICTLIKEAKGGFTFEAAVNTYAPIAPAKRTYKRTRMGHYMAKAITDSLRESVDAPNVPLIQADELLAVQNFGDQLVRNSKTDPINLPHLLAFGMDDPSMFNTASELAAGHFWLPFSAQISPDQEKIFLSLNYGESVTVQAIL